MPLGGAEGRWPRPQAHLDSFKVRSKVTRGDQIKVMTFIKARVAFKTFITVVLNLHVNARQHS